MFINNLIGKDNKKNIEPELALNQQKFNNNNNNNNKNKYSTHITTINNFTTAATNPVQ
jgi:hypothetical protein